MKKVLISAPAAIVLAALVLAAPALAGVTKRTKSDVVFRGFGTFTAASSTKLIPDMQWTSTVSDFKGKGLAGGLVGKTLLRSGDTGQIIDLSASTLTQLDNKKREYTVEPIKKLSEQLGGTPEETKAKPGEEEKSTIKVTKNEFKVEDTGETSTINTFPCRKYLVLWLMEWEDTQTKEKGSSKLESVVWTTPETGALQEAKAEEMKFAKAYMEKIGLNVEPSQRDILGTSWMGMLDAFRRPGARPRQDLSLAAAEMQKIKGYPIVIDGKYDVTGQKTQAAAGEAQPTEEESPKGVKGALGGFLKKSLKKNPADTTPKPEEPMLTYRIEVLELETPSLGKTDFRVPPDYKKKG
jgi:hypothetical protein